MKSGFFSVFIFPSAEKSEEKSYPARAPELLQNEHKNK